MEVLRTANTTGKYIIYAARNGTGGVFAGPLALYVRRTCTVCLTLSSCGVGQGKTAKRVMGARLGIHARG